MVLSEEEYIAESRDPTPEPTTEIIERGLTPTHGILKKNGGTNGEHYNGEEKKDDPPRAKEQRVPDMQLGSESLLQKKAPLPGCRYVRLHDNVNYVAAAIIFRGSGDQTEILLIQEAKKSCYGKWYMPAGRVEAGETLEESVQREVLEETGYSCNVLELLSLQVQGSGWYRFAFYCDITGGELKTKADIESLSAQWFPVKDVMAKKMELRGKDFLKLVDEALVLRKKFNEKLPRIMPANLNVQGLFIEFMIVRHSLDESKTEVLVHKNIKDETMLMSDEQPFPTVEFGFEYFFAMVVSKCYRHLLEEGANVIFSPSHVTKVKCHPKPMESVAHGVSVRVYCEHKKSATKAVIRSPRYHWLAVASEENRNELHINKAQYRASLHML